MPPRKKVNPNDVTADLDDLLSPADEEDFIPDQPAEELPVNEDEEMTEEEAAELAALQAELAKPVPEAEPTEPRFIPYAELSPAQKKIRDLRDAVARRDALVAEQAPVTYDRTEGASVLVHILEDGFTACGVVWYRGQEIRFVRGGEAYEQTKNRDGETWLDLDEAGQWDRWGKKMFGVGPWPGKRWGDVSGLTDTEEIQAATRAAATEARRKAAAPIIRA